MKLQDQVVNLELSKEMKKLGFKQDSLFYWIKAKGNKYWELAIVKDGHDTIFFKDGGLGGYGYFLGLSKKNYSAYTCAELGETLSSHFVSWKVQENYYICEQLQSIKNREKKSVFADTEANVRAKMLIYLKKMDI